MTAHDLSGWLPFFLTTQGGGPSVEWGYMGGERFVEPFFSDTLVRLMARPFNRAFRQRSPLELLERRAQSHPGLPLQGIIFHMSRCGSTLAAQSLAALGDAVALSEPEPVGTLLEWLVAGVVAEEDGPKLLRGLLAALGQPRRAGDARLFLKTECWHICHIGRILASFPGVPWAFLYREPVEVLVSHARMPSLYMIPGSQVQHGLTPPPTLLAKPLEHAAWMLAAMLRAAADAMARHPGGLLLNYRELPDALESRLAAHFNLALGGGDLAAWRSVHGRDAKQPHQSFQPDAAEKQADANAGLREAAARRLDGPYAELERLRLESLKQNAHDHAFIPPATP